MRVIMKADHFDSCTISNPQGRDIIVNKIRDLTEIIFDDDELYFSNQLDISFYMRASFSDFTDTQRRECWRNIQTSLGTSASAWSVQTYILCCYIIHRYYHESCSERTSQSPHALREARILFFDLFKQIYLNDVQIATHGYQLHVSMYFCLYMSYQHYYLDSDFESSLWNLYIDGLFYYLDSNTVELSNVLSLYKEFLNTTKSSNEVPVEYDNLLLELQYYYKAIPNTHEDEYLPILDSSAADYHQALGNFIP